VNIASISGIASETFKVSVAVGESIVGVDVGVGWLAHPNVIKIIPLNINMIMYFDMVNPPFGDKTKLVSWPTMCVREVMI